MASPELLNSDQSANGFVFDRAVGLANMVYITPTTPEPVAGVFVDENGAIVDIDMESARQANIFGAEAA